MAAATEISPSRNPLQFTELVVFFRDTPPLPMPSTSELPPVAPPSSTTTDTVNPKGIAFSHVRNKLIVSLARNMDFVAASRSTCLKEVDPVSGNRALFAGDFRMYRGVESKIAVVPTTGPGGFTPGEIFVGTGGPGGQGNEIARIVPDGSGIQDPWMAPGPSNTPLWGGLTFDLPGGTFGGNLLVLNTNKVLFKITYDIPPVIAQVANLGDITLDGVPHSDCGSHSEGLAVAPSTFGTHAGKAIVGMEGSLGVYTDGGKIFAVTAAPAATTLADIHSVVEQLVFVPDMGGTLFVCHPDFSRESANKILVASASQFMGRRGQLIALNEMSGEFWAIAWTGSAYTQQIIGRSPGRWNSEGLELEGTELEQCCFAVKTPATPSWTSFAEVTPAGFTTDQHVAVTTQGDSLHLVARADGTNVGFTAGHLYKNTFTLSTQSWGAWTDLNFPTTTNLAPAVVMQEQVLHVIAVQASTNDIFHKNGSGSWQVIPGGMKTTLAGGVALVNGEVIVCVKNASAPNTLQINSLRPTGQGPWTGWSEVPGGDIADYAPAVAPFQDELYIIRVSANKIYARARTTTGAWTDSAEIPGAGGTNIGIGAAGVPPFVGAEIPYSRQLYLFLKGQTSNKLNVNVASEVGTWLGWSQVDAVSTTDRAIAACVTDASTPVLYLFIKGAGDKKIYWRKTT